MYWVSTNCLLFSLKKVLYKKFCSSLVSLLTMFFFFTFFSLYHLFYSFLFVISSKVLHDSKVIRKLSFCKSSSKRFIFLSQKKYKIIIYEIFLTFECSINYINVQYIVIEWLTKTLRFLLYSFIYFYSYFDDKF